MPEKNKKTIKKPKKIAQSSKLSVSRKSKRKKIDVTDTILALNQSIVDYDFYNSKKKSSPTESQEFSTSGHETLTEHGVDFAQAGKSRWSQLSIVWLFNFIFRPVITYVQNRKTYQPYLRTEQPQENFNEDIFAPRSHVVFLGFRVSKKIKSSLIVFFTLAFFLILPLQLAAYYQNLKDSKEAVTQAGKNGFSYLVLGKDHLEAFNFSEAKINFQAAQQEFLSAQRKIQDINWVLEIAARIANYDDSIATADQLLSVGYIFSEMGADLSASLENFTNTQGRDYYQALSVLYNDLLKIKIKFQTGKKILARIDARQVPTEYQSRLTEAADALVLIEKGINDAVNLSNAALKMLGGEKTQSYLLVFANNNELRGVGGFMGSFAVLDLDKGKVKDLQVPSGGTYDVQGQLAQRVKAPDPLRLINSRWEFQDANWWPDWPSSARKIQWFYQEAGGKDTDGVFLMTAEMMSRIVGVLGPIPLPQYDVVVNEDNFSSLTQEIIRETRDAQTEAKPKQFLTDLTPVILERIFNVSGDQAKLLIETLRQGLNEKEIVLYFEDQELQTVVGTLEWGGQIKSTDGDYLMVVNANIAGGKTDQVITQDITHVAHMQTDGSIINTVIINRTHHGIPGENIFTGVQNNNYVRVYVPAGSVLLEATGFQKPDEKLFEQPSANLQTDVDLLSHQTQVTVDEKSGTDVYQENGKTVFGNWLQLKPGQSQEAIIRYRLPFTLTAEQNVYYYSMVIQKQSGAQQTTISSQVKPASGFVVNSAFPATVKTDGTGVTFFAPLLTDQFYAVNISKP